MTAAVLISFLFVRRGTERVYVRGEFGLYTGVSKREIWRMFLEPVLAVVVAARMMTKTVLIFRTEYLLQATHTHRSAQNTPPHPRGGPTRKRASNFSSSAKISKNERYSLT